MKNLIEVHEPVDRAILVGVKFANSSRFEVEAVEVDDPLDELSQLAYTAGVEVLAKVNHRRLTPDAAYFIGRGKAEELKALKTELEASLVIFDDDLKPAQLKNLEELLEVGVMDRTELILAIFEKRAKTREAKLQVELAQLEYQLPRLAHQWTHLSRIVGVGAGHGMGTTRGPGETQLQLDRKLIRIRISALKNQLDEVKQHRQIQRQNREDLLSVAIVGYTNAGKSTLLNALTGENAIVEDKLFATLDPMTRLVFLPDQRKALITDTVGFIRKLPHHLVASFRATLEEVIEADILLQVVDASHPEVYKQIEAVNRVLDELGVAERPVLMVLNKVDKLENYNDLFMLQRDYPEAIPISAATGEGLALLKSRLSSIASKDETTIYLKLSAADGRLISDIHEYGKVSECRYENDSVFITATMPKKYASSILLRCKQLD